MNIHTDVSEVQNTISEIEKTIKSDELKSIDLSPRELVELCEYDIAKDSKQITGVHKKNKNHRNIDDIILNEVDIDGSVKSKTN